MSSHRCLSKHSTAAPKSAYCCAGTPKQELRWVQKVWQALRPSLSPSCGRRRLCLLGGPWQSCAGESPLGRSQVPSRLSPASSLTTAIP